MSNQDRRTADRRITDRRIEQDDMANGHQERSGKDRRVSPAVGELAIQQNVKLRESHARLLEAALFVVNNLPGALSNALGKTSYDEGDRAAKIAERELVNLRAAIAQATQP